MKIHKTICSKRGLTRIEVLVVAFTLVMLVAMLLSALAAAKKRSSRITCINNISYIGLSYRMWGGDHGDKYPPFVSVTNGGILEMASQGSRTIILNFLTMSNELTKPIVLHCPEDKRTTETRSFSTLSASNISYFINLNAADAYPQMILSGDDNLAVNGLLVKPGILSLQTNDSIGWTLERHRGNGNVGLADGSAMQVTTSGLQSMFLSSGTATNRIIVP